VTSAARSGESLSASNSALVVMIEADDDDDDAALDDAAAPDDDDDAAAPDDDAAAAARDDDDGPTSLDDVGSLSASSRPRRVLRFKSWWKKHSTRTTPGAPSLC